MIDMVLAMLAVSTPIVIAVIILKKSRDKAEIREAKTNPGEGKGFKTKSGR